MAAVGWTERATNSLGSVDRFHCPLLEIPALLLRSYLPAWGRIIAAVVLLYSAYRIHLCFTTQLWVGGTTLF